jgi:hypothetical protein
MEDKIVVYNTYYNPIEANIIKSKLEDSEIPCFLTDENISTIQPLFNQAVGGVKLNVFEKDIPQINELLADIVQLDVDYQTNENEIVCENCKSENVSYGQATKERFSWWVTIVSLLLFVYPFKVNKCYHCYDCGHEFK